MGIFGSMFGSLSGAYSQTEHALSEIKIKELVSRVRISSLSQQEEQIVEQEIIKGRLGDGKISMRKIDEILRKLVNTNKISIHDKKSLMKVFSSYFNDHFGTQKK